MKLIMSVEPIRNPLTGIGRYTLELLKHLQRNPAIEEIRYFSDGRVAPQIPDPIWRTSRGMHPVAKALKGFVARQHLPRRLYRYGADSRNRRQLEAFTDWVYHGPNFYVPPVPGPAVATFHDLSVLTMPDFHPIERVRFMTEEIAVALKRVSMIITDSEFVRGEVMRLFSWPADRVRTVHLAAGAAFHPRHPHELAPALERHGLKAGGFCLYAGTIEPRKNLVRLLTAYEQLQPRLREKYPLVLVGLNGWRNQDILARIRSAEQRGWARYLGYIDDAQLPLLFAGARLFVYPSLHEGFGLPVLEAMASGTPVVCSNSSSLPEVAGKAAAMVEPEDVDALAHQITRGLECAEWRAGAATAGLGQATRFSWNRCAAETAKIYFNALGWRDLA
jgi:alpha-1,3-rhamnosyl/mannosyltransferase